MPILELSPDAIPPLEACPPPHPPLGAELRLIPTTLDELHVVVRPGWSLASGDRCWSMTATHEAPGRESIPASLGSTGDCIALPEPPIYAALVVGLVVLAALRRR